MNFCNISIKAFVMAYISLFSFQTLAIANNQTVICSSNNYQYAYCRVSTGNKVRLQRQLSSFPCQEGKSWGFDANGIWVDKGCQAEFTIENFFNNSNVQNPSGSIPVWSVGNFQGVNLRDHTISTISISPSGAVIAVWAGQSHTGYFDGYQLTLGNLQFAVIHKNDGFQTTLRTDHGNQVLFKRIP